MCKIIFLGGVWLKNEEQNIIDNSKGVVQIAANTLQMAIINGLDSISDSPVTILSEKFIGAFPRRYKKLIIKSKQFNHSDDRTHIDYDIGFINLPIYKHISRYLHSKKYIKKHCKAAEGENVYIIGYSMTQSVINELCYIKKIFPKAKTCLVVPDLPEYMNFGFDRGFLFRLLKEKSSKDIYKKIYNIDSFVVLTKYIYERLGVEKPYTVVEGVASDNFFTTVETSNDNLKRIVYTGTLSTMYGICELVDAFSSLEDENLRLIICGSGNGQKYIEDKAKEDKRIIYKGNVSNEEARRIQREAFLLVNPRNSKEEYTKYSFPSKTMEYMVSGRPVLMYKLSGIPDEYDSYLYYVDNNLAETLKNITEKDISELNEMGKKAREFVLSNKNQKNQAVKILQMLKQIKD